MKKGRIIFILLIGFLFIYIIYAMVGYSEGTTGRQAEGIQQIINKALVQCYALEGYYPATLDYIENYGVIFDPDKYIYFYEWFGANIKPNIIVLER
jgi:hypothetical protein